MIMGSVNNRIALLALLLAITVAASAQSRWKKYDSIYYENLFVPNFSNLLMPKGYVEVLLNNSLLTADKAWADNGHKIDFDRRYSYNFVTAIANIGVSEKNDFNAGVEVHYSIGYTDQDRQSSPLRVFAPNSATSLDQAQAFTSFGPRIKWRPFKKTNFVYVSTLQLPLVKDVYKKSVLGGEQVYWGNQFLYSFSAGRHFTFFAEDDIYAYFKKGTLGDQYLNSINLYAYVIASKHFFPFLSAGYSTLFQGTPDFKLSNRYVPLGAGLQYQHSLKFTLNIYYAQYVAGKSYTDWKTFSVGLRRVF